jgi:hypothetical protein
VKFRKFFAWVNGWIDRVLDSRQVEPDWMAKGEPNIKPSFEALMIGVHKRITSVMFYLLWMYAPTLVLISSFFAFVAQGSELTVSVAFTVGADPLLLSTFIDILHLVHRAVRYDLVSYLLF